MSLKGHEEQERAVASGGSAAGEPDVAMASVAGHSAGLQPLGHDGGMLAGVFAVPARSPVQASTATSRGITALPRRLASCYPQGSAGELDWMEAWARVMSDCGVWGSTSRRRRLVLSDGRQLSADLVVYATGFELDEPFSERDLMLTGGWP